MKIVAKYTLVLGAALIVALAVLAFVRVEHDRERFMHEMEADHRVLGRLLQTGVTDLWLDRDAARATRQTMELIERANENAGAIRFAWIPGTEAGDDSQRIEGHDFVSRFPVRVSGTLVGSVVGREPLDAIDQLVRHDVVLTAIELGLIVIIGLVLSLVLGRWLVGRPISRLVQQARAIGARDFTGAIAVRRADELGELATEMKAMSDALSTALATIAIETEARIRAVEQLRHSERLSTVGKLAAGIAHELGTPLSIVAGHAQMIAGREVAGDAALQSAEAIDREVTRMGRIVRQLLDFARRKGPEGTTCEAGEIARRCISLLAPIMDRAKVRCEVDTVDPPPRVLIDEDSLQQVLTNLVLNATQAMASGGVVTIAIDRAPAGSVRIEIRDTGPGIPEDVRPHIFEPFFTTKEAGDGTGLGLAVVYGIVVDHRGSVTVDSSARGTTVAVVLQEAT
jgi:signal transduction histidine kinase